MPKVTSLFSRRNALIGIAGSSAAALAWSRKPKAEAATQTAAAPGSVKPLRPAPACVLTPQSDDGPYFLDARLVRPAIAEDRQGVPLTLEIGLMDATHCAPLKGARVDIWHADARGAYSGYKGQGDGGDSTVGRTFLRGTQMSDSQGNVRFDTIYPGWYEGRTTHIHAKVFLADRSVFACQLFLPDAVNEFLYTNVSAYTGRTHARETVNRNDPLVTHDDPHHLAFFSIREAPDRYVASIVLGVNPLGAPPDDAPPVGFLLARALGIAPGSNSAMGTTRIASLIPGLR